MKKITGTLLSKSLASVGNSIATEDADKKHRMGGDMLFPFPMVILFCVYFCLLCSGDICCVCRQAAGLRRIK